MMTMAANIEIIYKGRKQVITLTQNYTKNQNIELNSIFNSGLIET